MATVRKWANVAVSMQSALAAAKTISAITLANPGVVTSTAHGYSNGTYVLLSIQGMYQLDQKVVRVANQTANTFELEGVDTTSFQAFSSGSAQAITFGTTITSATSMSATGGDFDFIDTTTIHGNTKTQVPGIANPIVYTFDNLWDIADAGQIAMKVASDNQSPRAFMFQFGAGGPRVLFNGYVGFTGAPTGNAQDKVTASASITAYSTLTNYAS